MNCKDRLTIKYDGAFAPKECCSIDRNGEADNFNDCLNICDEQNFYCDECPIQKCFNRLGELEDKLENGTLIELPYKVGNSTIKSDNGEDVITSKKEAEARLKELKENV